MFCSEHCRATRSGSLICPSSEGLPGAYRRGVAIANTSLTTAMTGCKRTALITGGSAGIGAACVRSFLRSGWNVSVLALRDSNLSSLGGDEVMITPGDVTQHHIREAAVERTLAAYGRIDVLVNSAGVGLYAPPSAVPTPMFSRLLDINVLAPLALAQIVIPMMRAQGGGTIVNIGSVAGLVSLPWAAAYSAAKFALDSVGDSLRRELSRDAIHVLKVCPGIVATDFRDHVLAGAVPPAVTHIRWVVSPDLVAARIQRAIERGQNVLYVPRIGRLFGMADAVAPWLMDLYLSRYLPPTAMNTPQLAKDVRSMLSAAAPK